MTIETGVCYSVAQKNLLGETINVVSFVRINLHRVYVTRDGGAGEMSLKDARELWVKLISMGYHRKS